MPQYSQPFAFQCACGKVTRGRPGYYRMQEHIEKNPSGRCGPKNGSTNQLGGKKRRLSSV